MSDKPAEVGLDAEQIVSTGVNFKRAGTAARESRHYVKKVCQRHAEHLGDQTEIQNGQVTLAAFDRTDERAVQIAPAAKLGLGPFVGLPVLADTVAKVTQEFLVVEVHGS
jgi:hypothetical protein